MKERFAEAQEQVTYAETVGPAETVKMAPVPERVYHDKEGNIIDPANEIDAKVGEKGKLDDLPVIGKIEDPLVTMPMQKIVSDDGKVISDSNDEVRTFIQPPKKAKGLSVRNKAIIILVVIFTALAITAAFMNSAGLLDNSEIVDSDPVEEVTDEQGSQDAEEQTGEEKRYEALTKYYTDLGGFRGQVNNVVSNFNNYHQLADKQKRQQYADECNALITSITDSKAALIEDMNELGLKDDDPLFSTYEQINHLYELLLTRLNVIKQCWDLSLTFDTPKEHAEEILAPLSQDIVKGKSASIAEFDETYANVEFPDIETSN